MLDLLVLRATPLIKAMKILIRIYLRKNLIASSQIEDSEICKSSNSSNATQILYNLRLENPNWIIIGHLNINSIRNTFDIQLLLSQTKSMFYFCQKQK